MGISRFLADKLAGKQHLLYAVLKNPTMGRIVGATGLCLVATKIHSPKLAKKALDITFEKTASDKATESSLEVIKYQEPIEDEKQ